MKFIAICLIVLIASSSATSIFDRYPLNFSSKRSIMTLLTQIEAVMKNGGPLDAVTKMLNEFELTIKQEQLSHDNLYSEQQASCATEIDVRTNAVKEADNALNDAKTRLESCQSQLHRCTDDLEITDRQLIENKNQLGKLIASRRSEEYTFKTVEATYEKVKEAISAATQILQEIWDGQKPQTVGFVELAKHMTKMISHTSKSRTTHMLNGVMSALAQIASKDLQADEALFDRIKNMLNTFLDRQAKNFEDAYAQNEAAKIEFDRASNVLKGLISHLTDQQTELSTESKKLNTCIVVQTGNSNSADAKKSRNSELLSAAISLCHAADEEYTNAKASRKEELELLGQIKERVKARFAQISEGVTQRGEQDDFTHTNDYSYQQPTFTESK